MKLLYGSDLAGFIQERHARQVPAHQPAPRLAIVRQGATPATDMYLRLKQRYGEAIGLPVDCYTEAPDTLLDRIAALNTDPATTGIIIQLPFADTADPSLVDQALAAVTPTKDVDGLAPHSPYEVATVKGIVWLLAGYNLDLTGRAVIVVGQGRLVGAPLARQLEAGGHQVTRADITTPNLAAATLAADVIISATGQAGLITSAMVKPGAIVIDAGAPDSDLAPDLLARTDLIRTPNPGGVGPMTVAALFDNVLIAAGNLRDTQKT